MAKLEPDLVRMEKPSDDPGGFIDIRKAPQNYFAAARELAQARAACKRAKFLFFENYDADVGLMKACAENGCTLVVSISDLLHLPPFEKAKKIGRMRLFVFLARHYGAKVRVCSLAKNELEIRNKYEIGAIMRMLGM